MSERSTRPTAWIRPVCRTAAALLTAALLAAPGTAAQGAPLFDVSVSPTAAMPGQEVTVSITPLDESLEVTGCRAELAGRANSECMGSNGHWSAHLTIPRHAKPGTAMVVWSLGYQLATGGSATRLRAKGTKHLTILSQSPPDFSVSLDPASARAGETVTATFTALDPKTTIMNCSARLAGITFFDCAGSGSRWILPFTVPATADVPDTIVDWDLVYERGGDGAKASGTTPFTVLPVVVASARSDSAGPTSTVPTSTAPTHQQKAALSHATGTSGGQTRSRRTGDVPPSRPGRWVTAQTETAPTASAPTGVDGTARAWDDSDLGVLVVGMIALAGLSLPFGRRSLRRTSRDLSPHLPPAEPGRAVARGFADAAGHAEVGRR